MKRLLTIFVAIIPLCLFSQSLSENNNKPVTGQFVFKFSNPEWRKELGHPKIFTTEAGIEARFFSYGIAQKDIKYKINKFDIGPYQGMNDWINFAMMSSSINDTKDYITISEGKGLLIWIYSTGFINHEEVFDTKCFFHLIVNAPEWPKLKDLEVYYIEDYRSDAIAEVFTLDKDISPDITEENGKIFINIVLHYNPDFGGGEFPVKLELSGAVQLN